MRHSRSSLITETQILKLPKLNSTFKQNEQQNKRCSKKERFYIRPEIKKILYSPFDLQESTKMQKKQMMVESCLLNKNYEDIKQQAFEAKIKSYLTENKSMNLERRTSNVVKGKTLIGKQAPFEYYKQYKRLGKLVEKAHFNKQNYAESPYLAMLHKTQTLDLLPLTLGIVKFQGDSSILNLDNYNLGDKYIIAMSQGLKKAKLIQKCKLSSNRMTNKGFSELVKCLNYEVNTLDVSFNQITELDDRLMQLIAHPEARLEKLNLQSNQVKKPQIIYTLVQNITISKHLKVLNLRSNGITVESTDHICELIDTETRLQELYLGSNFLTSKSAERIFELLAKNKNIKVFDYSLNNLGEDQNNQCANMIANCLTKNKHLLHVDLSSNNFSEQGSKIIANGLEPNKKIYGFHFHGNHGYVDSRGFLLVDDQQITSLHSIVQNKIDSYNVCFKRHSTSASKIFKNVCWICEGWYEQQFRFNIPEDFNNEKKFVYLHFDFEMFAPRLINISDKHVRYTTMVPPTKYRYFFTFDEKQFTDKHAKVSQLEFPQKYTYQMYHKPIQIQIHEVSERSKAKPRKIVNDWNQIIISTLPRNTGLVSKKQKQKWTYEKSMWAKQWKLQNEDLLKKCFEKDWKCSKIMNLVKSQQDQDKVRDQLYKAYRQIKMAYRYFSSWSPFGDIWAVSNNAWTEFCQQGKIINKDTPLKITDLTFITTNSISGADWKGNPLVPERGLVRFQFMQCIVRLSEQKFKKLGLTENFSDSVGLMLKDHVLPLTATLTYEKWRQRQYFVEQNDILIKKYRPIFSYIYRKNSKLKVKPGQKPFMCLNEFRSILQRANLAGTLVLERDIYVGFNFAMMTQVDQLENQKFIKMTEIQFIEAIARCASILPKTCTLSTLKTDPGLHHKFQWLINELKNTSCNEQIKSQFNEEGSIFDQNQEDQ